MRRILYALLAASAAAALFAVPAPASADIEAVVPSLVAEANETGYAVCKPPTDVEGYGKWTPAVTPVSGLHRVEMSLVGRCFTGTTGVAGRYNFTFEGWTDEGCAAGEGESWSASGSGPIGQFSGSMTVVKAGTHYTIEGYVWTGQEWYFVAIGVDVMSEIIYQDSDVCFYDYARVIGGATITEA